MGNQTLQNDTNNRGENKKEALVRVLRTLWLRSTASAQTPREDMIAELLERYYNLTSIFDQFKDFTFAPKKPTRILIL